ncbi:enoyl-CoA hydratase/isomerase family protein [Prauserella oleivorans]
MSAVRWAVTDGIGTVTLDRPDVRNALDDESWTLLADAVAELRAEHARAMVLTGGDRFFSSGGDVSSMGGAGGRVARRRPAATRPPRVPATRGGRVPRRRGRGAVRDRRRVGTRARL